jgi:hypothetical protein
MKFLAFLVLLSALAIAGCAGYFSIVGLTLLFVGSGTSIIVMGAALEIGKIIVVTVLHHKWNEISILLKSYLVIAALVLTGITSIGIYGYLSAGYNATAIKVQAYDQQIESNNKKIEDIKADNIKIANDPLNEKEIELVNTNKNKFVEQQLQLIAQKEIKIKSIRESVTADKKSSDDMIAAKASLDADKVTLESEINKEVEQIKLFNSRLEILDKEVQTWLNQGNGSFFKESGMDKARVVKSQQEKERSQIDIQIKERQNKIESLRSEYKQQVDKYNTRITSIEARLAAQTNSIDENVKALEKEIIEIRQGIDSYNKTAELTVKEQIVKKEQTIKDNKLKLIANEDVIQKLLTDNNLVKEKIIHTDVGTFKFVANSLGLSLDKTVNFFIWSIMSVFDPLAVCLIICFNYLIKDISNKKKDEKLPQPIEEPVSTITPGIVPEPTPSMLPVNAEAKEATEEIVSEVLVEPEPTPVINNLEGEVLRLQNILKQQREERALRKSE